MHSPFRRELLAAALLLTACDPAPPRAAEPAQPVASSLADGEVRSSTLLPAQAAACLPQSVKDLGVGARMTTPGRGWEVGPEKLHAALANRAEVRVSAAPSATMLAVEARARWTGALEGNDRAELERRLEALVGRIAFFCGEHRAQVRCESGPAGALGPCATASE